MPYNAVQCAAENHEIQGFLAVAVELTLNDTADMVLPTDADR